PFDPCTARRRAGCSRRKAGAAGRSLKRPAFRPRPCSPHHRSAAKEIPMLHWMICLAVGGVAAVPPGDCPPPAPVRFETRTVTRYRTEYRTEFKEVQRAVTRQVPETVLKEVSETVMVPHWEEVTRQKTVMTPVTRLVPRQREVVSTEWVKQ